MIGEVVSARVDRIEPYGVYLSSDQGEFIVLIPDLSWRRFRDPHEVVAVGETVKLQVLRHIPERGEYRGSIRATQQEINPYRQLAVGQVVDGKVQGIFGGILFVGLSSLEPAFVVIRDYPRERDLPPNRAVRVRIVSVDLDPEDTRAHAELVDPEAGPD